MCEKWAKSITKCEEWSTWRARAGGDKEMEYSDAVYTIKRRLAGKWPMPRWRRGLDKEEDFDVEFDSYGEFECW
eukprot:237480-Pyramimonas_sp.AAC.1